MSALDVERRGFDLVGFDLVGFDLVGFDLVGFDLVGFDLVGFDLVGFDLVGFDLVGFDLVGFDLVGKAKSPASPGLIIALSITVILASLFLPSENNLRRLSQHPSVLLPLALP
ncbi:hypothetical protein [Chitinimonas lacunae]|uniref:Pentapeptide repeat-containing protein n=1 Tax=Chitinimonas lacunae TaxID=1963018 RepID=A0ABV8MN04_9NEIS